MPDGYLWLGTLGGLVRFDGARFGIFDREQTQGLESNRIRALHVDRSGHLWIGTEGGGLTRFDGERFASFTQADGLPSSTVLSLASGADGTLWIGTDGGGLARFDGERFRVYAGSDGPGATTIPALHVDRSGHLWIGTEGGGLTRFDGERFASFTQADGLPSSTVLSLASGADGTLWIGTDGGGLARLSGGRIVPAGRLQDVSAPVVQYVHSLAVDRSGNLWLATLNGLMRAREGASRYTVPHAELPQAALPRDNVFAVFQDREGNVWAGTERGLVRLKEAIFDVYAEAEGLPDEPALAVYQDRAGALWVGTRCGGMSRLQQGSATTFGFEDGLSDPCVWSIREDRAGTLWVGTQSGLNRLEGGRFTALTTEDGLANDFVLAIYEDRAGVLWVGTRGGLNRLEEGRFTTYSTEDGLVHNWVRYILQDREGALWIATAGGLSRFQDGAFRNFTTDDGLSSNDLRALYEDPDGVLWIGTFDGGLNRFEDNRFVSYSTRDGLADNRVTVVLEDDDGFLWMGGNRGVQRVSRRALNAFATGRINRVAATLFSRSDGLLNPQCTGGFQPAGWRTEDGQLWFPTIDGVAAIDPALAFSGEMPPPVLIEQVLVNGQPVEAKDRVILPRGQRDLEIRYTSPGLRSPERLQFRFRMEDLDESWIEAGRRRQAYYLNVPPGDYTFRVVASADGERWQPSAASLTLAVPPYLHETVWFWALCAFGLFALALTVYRLNTRRLEARAEKLQHLVDQRTRALKEEKERTEAALQEAEQHRKVAQSALATVEEQAVQLLRMDHLKSRFFANISHEFRTPLTLVSDPLERALGGAFGPLDEAFEQRVRVALRNARLLLGLINQLLDLARIEAGGMELRAKQEDLVPLLRGIVQVFSSEAERLQIILLFAPAQEQLPAYFDRDKLEKIMFNLISNALKATPAGGKVMVSVRQTGASDTGAEYAEVAVRDTGIGIPAERLPHIFDRFYQVKGPSTHYHAGAGIGLSLVKEFVDMHRGQVDVESVPGFGTAFTFRLPLGRDHLAEHEITEEAQPWRRLAAEDFVADIALLDAPPEPLAEAVQPPAGEADRPLVLVVEDHPDVRGLIHDHLAPTYRVVEAANGLEGIRKARETHPDLVISDVVMPEMEGIAFCRLLKQDRQLGSTPVILLTARASEESRIEGLRVGADDYLTKPFSGDELLTRVDNLIRSRRTMRDQFSQEVVLRPAGVVVPSAEATFLERVREVVELHLEDGNFTVGMLAAEVGISEAQLKRRLRAAVGQAPVEFIRNLRLERAAELLRQRAGNVSEVAFAVGFQNLPYFAKCFRERFGVPPSRYLARSSETGDHPEHESQ